MSPSDTICPICLHPGWIRCVLARPLNSELAGVAALGYTVDFLEDDLANGHALPKADLERADVPNLQADLRPRELRGVGRFAEPGMNGRGGHVDPQANASEAALPLDAGGDPGSVRELDLLQRPAQHETPRLNNVALTLARLRLRQLANQFIRV